jgi:hypothetical protein
MRFSAPLDAYYPDRSDNGFCLPNALVSRTSIRGRNVFGRYQYEVMLLCVQAEFLENLQRRVNYVASSAAKPALARLVKNATAITSEVRRPHGRLIID